MCADKKTEVAMLLLPHLLVPPPPNKGVKRPLMSSNAAAKLVFYDFEDQVQCYS